MISKSNKFCVSSVQCWRQDPKYKPDHLGVQQQSWFVERNVVSKPQPYKMIRTNIWRRADPGAALAPRGAGTWVWEWWEGLWWQRVDQESTVFPENWSPHPTPQTHTNTHTHLLVHTLFLDQSASQSRTPHPFTHTHGHTHTDSLQPAPPSEYN